MKHAQMLGVLVGFFGCQEEDIVFCLVKKSTTMDLGRGESVFEEGAFKPIVGAFVDILFIVNVVVGTFVRD